MNDGNQLQRIVWEVRGVGGTAMPLADSQGHRTQPGGNSALGELCLVLIRSSRMTVGKRLRSIQKNHPGGICRFDRACDSSIQYIRFCMARGLKQAWTEDLQTLETPSQRSTLMGSRDYSLGQPPCHLRGMLVSFSKMSVGSVGLLLPDQPLEPSARSVANEAQAQSREQYRIRQTFVVVQQSNLSQRLGCIIPSIRKGPKVSKYKERA